MTKLLKTVLIAGSLITSTAIVSFADAPKTADSTKAGAGSAAAGSGSAAKGSTKGTTTPAKGAGSGAGSAAKSGK